MSKYIKTYKKDAIIPKQKIIIFDLDGCIADSDNFVITNEEAWKLDKSLFKEKPTKDTKKLFCLEYFRKHHSEIQPYYGIFELFVRLASITNVAIVTARFEIMKPETIEWLKENCIKLFNDATWRQLHFDLFFNEKMEKSLVYKKEVFSKLLETYDISLLVEDHPEVINWAKSKNINVLVPATGYKNLEGTDLTRGKKNAGSRISRAK